MLYTLRKLTATTSICGGLGYSVLFLYALVETSSKFGSEVAFLAFVNLIIGMVLAVKYWKKES